MIFHCFHSDAESPRYLLCREIIGDKNKDLFLAFSESAILHY